MTLEFTPTAIVSLNATPPPVDCLEWEIDGGSPESVLMIYLHTYLPSCLAMLANTSLSGRCLAKDDDLVVAG